MSSTVVVLVPMHPSIPYSTSEDMKWSSLQELSPKIDRCSGKREYSHVGNSAKRRPCPPSPLIHCHFIHTKLAVILSAHPTKMVSVKPANGGQKLTIKLKDLNLDRVQYALDARRP